MNTAAQPGVDYQMDDNQSQSASIIQAGTSAGQRDFRSACGHTDVDAQGARPARVVGTPIDVAFDQIDKIWKLDKRTLELMAADPRTPVVVLERLAVHSLPAVRAALSDNESTPLYTIWALSKDVDPDVRYQLAENHSLPAALIRSLTRDENPYVACRAKQTLSRRYTGGDRID